MAMFGVSTFEMIYLTATFYADFWKPNIWITDTAVTVDSR